MCIDLTITYFKDIIDASPDIIFIMDKQLNLITYNLTTTQYFNDPSDINFKDDSIISHSPFIYYIMNKNVDNISDHYFDLLIDYENNIFSGQTFYKSFGIKQDIYLFVIVKLFYDSNNEIVGGIELIRNITQNVNIREELAEYTKKIQNLFNIMPSVYLRLNSEGKFIDYEGNLNLLYFNPELIIGKSIYDDSQTEISKTFIDSIRHSIELSIPTQAEYSLNINNKTKHFLAKNMPLEDDIISVIHDISEQKELKETLEEYKHSRTYNLHQFVLTLMTMLKFNDPCTYYHQLRVANLASFICKKLEMSEFDTRCVVMAAKLHDIGKIAIPFEILNKHDLLTVNEYSMVRKHPCISFNLIKNLPFDTTVKIYIHQHHERLDGSGYPYELTGDDILLGSRILAVCDDMETLLSDRPYKLALTPQESLIEISSSVGTAYDVAVVRACEQLFLEGYEFPS